MRIQFLSSNPKFPFLLLILVLSIYSYFNRETLYCTDEIAERLAQLQSDVTYWQNDIKEVQARFIEHGFDKIPEEYLSEQSLKDKREMLQEIQDGRSVVSSSIAEIARYRAAHNLWLEREIVEVKRGASDTFSDAFNKRQR